MSFLDKAFPFFVGQRTELSVALIAAANLLCAVVPKAAPLVATANTFAPYAVALLAAARAARK